MIYKNLYIIMRRSYGWNLSIVINFAVNQYIYNCALFMPTFQHYKFHRFRFFPKRFIN